MRQRCVICKEYFEPKSKTHRTKYCGPACRKKAQNAQSAASGRRLRLARKSGL